MLIVSVQNLSDVLYSFNILRAISMRFSFPLNNTILLRTAVSNELVHDALVNEVLINTPVLELNAVVTPHLFYLESILILCMDGKLFEVIISLGFVFKEELPNCTR